MNLCKINKNDNSLSDNDNHKDRLSTSEFLNSYVDDEFYTDKDYESDRFRINLPCKGHANKIGPKFKFPHFAGFKLDIVPGQGFSIEPVFKFKK